MRLVSTITTALTTGSCDVIAVSATSAQGQAMIEGQTYRFVSTTACWLKFGSDPTAVAAADGNLYLPANESLYVLCQGGATKCAAIRASADGSLSQVVLA